jgi:hypothetical protein
LKAEKGNRNPSPAETIVEKENSVAGHPRMPSPSLAYLPIKRREAGGLLEAVEALEGEPEGSPAGAVLVDDDSAA